MVVLANALKAWGTGDFRHTLRQELERLDATQLPLQQGLSQSSHVSDSGFRVMVLNNSDKGGSISTKIGIFYAGVIAGCNCADDPTPVNEISEYCELDVEIDKASGEARITVSR
jgi:hypothetical protein